MRFIKVNDLKLTQVELFSFFHFMCVAANASELFYMARLENIERFFYTISTFILNMKFYKHVNSPV